LFTDLPLDEIARLEALEGAEINDAKKVLADLATELAHGEEAAREAAETARGTFVDGVGGDALPTLAVTGAIGLVDALVELGFCISKSEARRLIRQGGARVNGEKITHERHLISGTGNVRLSAGRKNHGFVAFDAV
jgi:tyrosyl-tRNA synthetase